MKNLRFAALVLIGGGIAGLTGMATVTMVELISENGPAVGLPMVAMAAGGGLVTGLGWWALRSRTKLATVAGVLRDGGRFPVLSTMADAFLQLLAVATGASVGRENAPRQIAGSIEHSLTTNQPDSDRRILLSAASAAGLAAVYNVPFAGVLFAFECLGLKKTWRGGIAVVVMSFLAALVARPVVGSGPYYEFPAPSLSVEHVAWMVGWTLLGVPVMALFGLVMQRGAAYSARNRPTPSWRLPLFIAIATGLVGLSALLYPQLRGNGVAVIQQAFSNNGTWALFLALAVLKPLLTLACLRAGAVGGTLAPSFATGTALGGFVALALAALGLAGPGDAASLAGFAVIGGAGVLAVNQNAPLFAAVIAWEFTNAPLWLAPMLIIGAYGTHWTAGKIAARLDSRKATAA